MSARPTDPVVEHGQPSSLSLRLDHAFAGQHERAQQDVADAVNELVESQQTVEQVEGGSTQPYRTRDGGWACRLPQRRRHVVEHGALLAQLLLASHSTAGSGEALIADPRSKPAARLDAIAAVQRVDRESRWWADQLGTRSKSRLVARLRGLVGGAGRSVGLVDASERTLVQAARSWVATARVVTGHDSPPYAPHVRCPEVGCERVGTLRVRLSTSTAICLECGRAWEGDEIGELAEWVTWATEHDLGASRHLVPDDEEVGVHRRPCAECALERAEYAERQRERRTSAKVKR